MNRNDSLSTEQMKDKEYKGDQVKGWSETVIRSILQELGKEEYQPYKYY